MVMQLDLIFPTPVVTGFCEEIDDTELKKIKKVCKQYLKNNESVKKSNIGGEQTDNIIAVTCNNAVLNNLIDIINRKLDVLKNELQIHNDIKVYDFWINRNNQYNYNLTHTHGDVTFAVVFYVSANEESGELVVHRPNSSELSLYKILGSNAAFVNDSISYFIQPKRFIIFPGWIPHSVLPNKSNKPRISIAFNCKFYSPNY
jgi:uncharacterized protein (TIGR02466 family)